MIDTDKYEGHTPAPWNVFGPYPLLRCGDYDDEGVAQPLPFTQADVKLIADAPLLLAEVMRLREAALKAREVLMKHYEWMSMNDATSEEDDQEILNTVKQLREASE